MSSWRWLAYKKWLDSCIYIFDHTNEQRNLGNSGISETLPKKYVHIQLLCSHGGQSNCLTGRMWQKPVNITDDWFSYLRLDTFWAETAVLETNLGKSFCPKAHLNKSGQMRHKVAQLNKAGAHRTAESSITSLDLLLVLRRAGSLLRLPAWLIALTKKI